MSDDDGTTGIALLVALMIGMVGVGWIVLRVVLLALSWFFAVAAVLVQM